jgi:hypothetical protein
VFNCLVLRLHPPDLRDFESSVSSGGSSLNSNARVLDWAKFPKVQDDEDFRAKYLRNMMCHF